MLDSIHITCPFCGERFEAVVDASGGDAEYVEDCPVCCHPNIIHVELFGPEEPPRIWAESE